MSDSNFAIEVEQLSKLYNLGSTNATLRESIAALFNKTSKKEESFWALKDVSFGVKTGESIGIIGKNGAGKSTLLKILSRITLPTEGRVTINGTVASLLEVGTGFHPELTGRENIYLNGSILGMARKEIQAKFDEIVAFSGIERFLDTPVKRYSSGMYVRLAFAVAAHLEPEILIVDEVLSVGDAEFQRKCLGKMGHVTSSGRTVLFVSHNMEAVRKMCSRTVWLEKGQIKMIGPSSEVIDAYLSELKENAETVRPGERSDREGSGVLRAQEIRFSNPEGTHLQSGKPMKVEIDYRGEGSEKLTCIATLGIHDVNGRRVGTLSTKLTRSLIDLGNGDTLTWEIPRLSLTPGKYFINIFLAHRTEADVIDWLQQAAAFEVMSASFHTESDEVYYEKDIVFIDHSFRVL